MSRHEWVVLAAAVVTVVNLGVVAWTWRVVRRSDWRHR